MLMVIQALDLGTGADPNSYMVEEIWQELAKARYLEWEHESSRRGWELQILKYVIFSSSIACCFSLLRHRNTFYYHV